MELTSSNVIQLVIQLVAIGVIYGKITTDLKHVTVKIDKLELKQDKHNNVIERMTVAEQKLEGIESDCYDNKSDLKGADRRLNEINVHLAEIHASVKAVHKRLDAMPKP